MDYSGNESSESDTSLSSDSEIQGGSEFSFNSTSFLGGVELFDLEDGVESDGHNNSDGEGEPSVTPNTTLSVTPKPEEEHSVSASSSSIIYEGGSDIEDSSPLFESEDEELECELNKLIGRIKIE
jgi:hypothetical protein